MAIGQATPLGYKTKAQMAYEALRETILNGSRPPGQRLVARGIAAELGMSEIPVREALQRLGREGLVTLMPHVGARVSDLLLDELGEILLIRSELEGLATRLAADHVSEELLSELERQIKAMDAVINSGNLERYGAMNRRFHQTIYNIVPYPQLRALIEELWNQEPRARSVFVLNPRRARASHVEHRQIMAALRARDGQTAGRIVRDQKLKARDSLRRRENRN